MNDMNEDQNVAYRFPMSGQRAENANADRNDEQVNHTEYKKAAKMAENELAPISVAPYAPSSPSSDA